MVFRVREQLSYKVGSYLGTKVFNIELVFSQMVPQLLMLLEI
jgi:hypothetical protein